MIYMREMYEYGYKWIGTIPLRDFEKAYKEYMDDKSVLILYPDNTESYVEDSSDFFRLENTVMYGLERSITETALIKKAIKALREFAEFSHGSDVYWKGYWNARAETYEEVLETLGFTNEEILLMIKEADLGFEEG